MVKKIKENSKCYVLYVNLTTYYISFKIEEGKFLGELKENRINDKKYFVVEHTDDEVDYVQMEDIFSTEKDAYNQLIKLLQKKVK